MIVSYLKCDIIRFEFGCGEFKSMKKRVKNYNNVWLGIFLLCSWNLQLYENDVLHNYFRIITKLLIFFFLFLVFHYNIIYANESVVSLKLEAQIILENVLG